MKKNLIILFLLLPALAACAQSPSTRKSSGVKWYSIQEAEKLSKQNPRPIFIDTYTDWDSGAREWTRIHSQILLFLKY
jgi:hypothetical protein